MSKKIIQLTLMVVFLFLTAGILWLGAFGVSIKAEVLEKTVSPKVFSNPDFIHIPHSHKNHER
jgi:uncharacterized protein involved in cysteine biosynthesis